MICGYTADYSGDAEISINQQNNIKSKPHEMPVWIKVLINFFQKIAGFRAEP